MERIRRISLKLHVTSGQVHLQRSEYEPRP